MTKIIKKQAAPKPVPAPKKLKTVKKDTVTAALEAATKPAAKAAPAPAAKAEAPAKEPKAKKGGPSKFVSVDEFDVPNEGKRRMRVAEYQDYTLSINDRRKLTDEELCADWQRQFPAACERSGGFNVFHVKGVRRDYNAGKHSKLFNTRPATPSIPYGAKVAAKTAS